MTMESFYATKLDEFAKGKISRRGLLEALTVAATTTTTVASSTANAAAASDPALKIALVNHISYNCPDFKKGADWYSKVFNLDQIGTTKIDTALPFGKKGEKPFGVTANDVPLTSIIVRTRDLNAPAQGGTAPRRKSRALIEHMGYTVADFDREKAKADLKALGVENVRDGGLYSLHMTDAFGYDVQISGIANNALTDGA
jgi:catechol 2,3-dioxygenase-like lactoylglutathione lyase family enzyme